MLWQALSIWSPSSGGTPCSCWWFHLTWHPSYVFANMLSYLTLSSLVCSSMLHSTFLYMASFFYAGHYFFVLFSISRSALLWPTLAEQFIALGPPVPATAPSHHWAVFGASTSQGCYLTNLCFCTWHHYGRVIKSWWYTIQRQNKRKQISCRHLVIRKNVVTAEPYWSKTAGRSVKVQTEQACQSSDLRSCKLSTTLMATC